MTGYVSAANIEEAAESVLESTHRRFSFLFSNPEVNAHPAASCLAAESRFYLTLVKCQGPSRWQHDRNRQENSNADPFSPMNRYEASPVLMSASIPALMMKAENEDSKPLEG